MISSGAAKFSRAPVAARVSDFTLGCMESANTTKTEEFCLTAQGFSMKPEILPGDIIHFHAVIPMALKPGDVAVFHKNGHLIAHRVVTVKPSEEYILEKGDGKYRPFKVPFTAIVGKVFRIERNGRFKNFSGLFQVQRSRAIATLSISKFYTIELLSRIKKILLGRSHHSRD